MSMLNGSPQVERESVWRRRFLNPVVKQMRMGITPEKVALSIALGVTFGVFPILGSTTLLCGFAAWFLRLNQPIIQLVNCLVYPLQIALLLLFYRAGESLFGKDHTSLSISLLTEQFKADPAEFFKSFGLIGLQGIVVWLLSAPLLIGLVYLILRRPLRVLASRVSA